MSDPALPLVLAMARALADGRRVLFAGESFEALQLLAAADVRELVLVSEGASETAGETTTGAPLRIRSDWAERAASKDLIVDPEGTAPPAEVKRLLKKKGLYLAGRAGPALKALASSQPVRSRRLGALAVGEAPQLTVTLADEGADGPVVQVGANGDMPELPGVLCIVAEGADEARGSLVVRTVERDEARAAVAGAEKARDQAQEQLTALTEERDVAVAALARVSAERDEARRALAEVEVDRDAVRDELAERRVQDRRAELVRTHFEETRRQMHAELDALRVRLREVDEPAADMASQRGEHEALRSAFARVAQALAHAAATDLPAPVPSEAALLDTWLARITARLVAAQEARGVVEARARVIEGRLQEAERRARELGEALREADASRADPAPAPRLVEGAPVAELRSRLGSLEAALEAERSLRRGESAELARLRQAAEALGAEAEALRSSLDAQRRDAAMARLARAALHDETERLRGELTLRDARLADVESMLSEHANMTRLLSETLDEAVRARESADGERRLADNNLRLLRAEMERGGNPAGPSGTMSHA